MNANEFVARLRSIQPAREDLLKAGVAPDAIDRFFDSFDCKARRHGRMSHADPIVDLIGRYDTQHLEVSFIKISPYVKLERDRFIVGSIDRDLIGIDCNTMEVMLLDAHDSSHVIAKLAVNSFAFLDVMFELARSTWPCVTNEPDDGFNIDTASRCAVIAGCPNDDFYQCMIAR